MQGWKMIEKYEKQGLLTWCDAKPTSSTKFGFFQNIKIFIRHEYFVYSDIIIIGHVILVQFYK